MRMYLKLILALPVAGLIVYIIVKLIEDISTGVMDPFKGEIIFLADSPYMFWFGVFAHGAWIPAGLAVLYRLFIGDPFKIYSPDHERDDESVDR